MHDCVNCGYACYCGGDIDDCEVGDICLQGCGCHEDEDDGGPVECRCGRIASADACQQCGHPLCGQCAEIGAGFCEGHPDENYAPTDASGAGL